MIPLINHDSQWGGSEGIIIYPDLMDIHENSMRIEWDFHGNRLGLTEILLG
jgi:hypothetical protein